MTAGEIARQLMDSTTDMSPTQIITAVRMAKEKANNVARYNDTTLPQGYTGRRMAGGIGRDSFDSTIISKMPQKIRNSPQAVRDYLLRNGMDEGLAAETTRLLNNSASRSGVNREIVSRYLTKQGISPDGRAVSDVMGELGLARRLGSGARRKGLAALFGTLGSAVLGANPLDMFLEAQPLGASELPGTQVIPLSGDEAIADVIGPRPMLDEEGNPIPTVNANPYAR
jgi:hypothetical protein